MVHVHTKLVFFPLKKSVSLGKEGVKEHECSFNEANISAQDVNSYVEKLKYNSSTIMPGIDGITSEHLRPGLSDKFSTHLASLYSTIITWGMIPKTFSIGIIVPVIKKSTANPNVPESNRPITLSTSQSKIIEQIITPHADISNTQFGSRENRDTSQA